MIRNEGLMKVRSAALTPDQVTETWQTRFTETWMMTGGTGTWEDAPKVWARMCGAEEKRAAAEGPEQEQQQRGWRSSRGAGAAARQCQAEQQAQHAPAVRQHAPAPTRRTAARHTGKYSNWGNKFNQCPDWTCCGCTDRHST
jgi:hypothetical protein